MAAHAAPGLGKIQPSLERPLIYEQLLLSRIPDECSLFLFISCYFYFGCPGRSYEEQKVLAIPAGST